MNLNEVADSLTPQQLNELVHELASRQPPDDRQSVTLTTLLQALTGSAKLQPGREGWQAYLHFKQVLINICALTPGLRYVEADS